MTYEETIELEENIKLKNKADEIYKNFLKNIKLDISKYQGDGKFLHWNDGHNSTYFQLKGDTFLYIAEFLHNSYRITVTPSSIFSCLKSKYRGVEHLESEVRDK